MTTTRKGAGLRSRLSPALREETGAIAIIVALFIVGLLVCVALVVDLGSLYDHDRELQTAVDAGVLAGAQELFYSKGNTALAEARTREYVSTNSAPNSSVTGANVTYELLNIDARSVEAQLRETGVEFAFAPVIGQTEGSVKAYAKAELMYLTGIHGLFPVALPYVHPDHFHMIFGDGADNIELRNAAWDSKNLDGDQGIYDSSSDSSVSPGPGLHSVSLVAHSDGDDEDLLTWDNIGSLYIPPGGDYPIQRVSFARDKDQNTLLPGATGELGETVELEIHTTSPVTDKDVDVEIQVANKKTKLKLGETFEGSGVYWGKTSLSTPAFTSGRAEVTITTIGKQNSAFPGGVTIARYTWFQRGEPLIYVAWDGYSVPGSATLNPIVRTKVLKFDTEIMIKPQFHDEGDYQGNDFWANIIVGQNLRTELEVALLENETVGADWELEPDVGGHADNPETLNNGYADIGEYLPYDNGVSVGHWSWIDGVAEGKVVYIPIVDPAASKSKEWRIQTFAAFLITKVEVEGGNRIAIIGEFQRELEGGVWDDEKPPTGIYVETAVLTK